MSAVSVFGMFTITREFGQSEPVADGDKVASAVYFSERSIATTAAFTLAPVAIEKLISPASVTFVKSIALITGSPVTICIVDTI